MNLLSKEFKCYGYAVFFFLDYIFKLQKITMKLFLREIN